MKHTNHKTKPKANIMTSCTFEYKKGFYIHCNDEEISATESPTGYGYTWRGTFKSVHAAKIAITKRIKETEINEKNCDEFTKGYAICALWSSNDESNESGGEPIDRNYSLSDITPETWRKFAEDCKDFQESNAELLKEYYRKYKPAGGFDVVECAGHDFWLTRNGHGCGFWDRGIGTVGDELADAAKVYGGADLYVYRGKVHQY